MSEKKFDEPRVSSYGFGGATGHSLTLVAPREAVVLVPSRDREGAEKAKAPLANARGSEREFCLLKADG